MRTLLSIFFCTLAYVVPVAGQQIYAAEQLASGETKVSLPGTKMTVKQALAEVAKQANLKLVVDEEFAPLSKSTALKLESVKVTDALKRVMQGTGAIAYVTSNGQTIVVTQESSVARSRRGSGVIAGRVTDAKSGRGISGATVSAGNTGSVATGEDGSYRLAGMDAGAHTVTVRLVGYAKQTRSVTVGDGATVTADFKLEPSANVLDQVIVTGTVVQTELKAVPNAVTVVTAKQIQERGITRIDQLFRGDIPGLFAINQGSNALLDEVTAFSRGATALFVTSVGTGSSTTPLTNTVKTYIDGVEMTNSKYLSQIDPKSIERIEILTGPQASTIYGSNAINGVMQIFTKRGATSRPSITLDLSSGVVQNNFSAGTTPQHDFAGQISGLEGRVSYNAGGSWNYIGPWTPAKQTSRLNSFGSARYDMQTGLGRFTADVSGRASNTKNLQRGYAQQSETHFRDIGWYLVTFNNLSGLSQRIRANLDSRTFGLAIGYAPKSWWTNELVAGTDGSNLENLYTRLVYISPSDSSLRLERNTSKRNSLRFSTTTRLPLSDFIQANFTLGADSWQSLATTLSASSQALTGSLTGSPSITRQPGHNTGAFMQTQIGFGERLFATYGLRAEWNPDFGEAAEPNYAPRYGLAYTHEIGELTAKLRGSYGRSTRPPRSRLNMRQTVADLYGSAWSTAVAPLILPYFGSVYDVYLFNPGLAPEHQQGGEGGLELYWGSRGSLVVTNYNQTVDGLISPPRVDSVRSLVPCPPGSCFADRVAADGYGYQYQYQYSNIGSVRNQGWELQSSINTGPLTTRGTYSWTKSRTIGVLPKFRPYFAAQGQTQYVPGASFNYLPEHTWALGITYGKAATTLSLNFNGTGRFRTLTDDFYYENISSLIRLPQNRVNVSFSLPYVNVQNGYTMADFVASHRFTSKVEGTLQVFNLGDTYKNDVNAAFSTIGRQSRIGARLRW